MAEKKGTIFNAIVLISVLSVFSKIIGFLREGVIAACFGTTAETDVYFLFYNIFSTLFYIITHPISVSFLILFVRYKNSYNEQYAIDKFSKLLVQFIVISLVIAALCISSYYIVPGIYNGLDNAKFYLFILSFFLLTF